jgi:hypothetical protein
MGQRYTTYQTEVPVVFPMPCVRHALVGQEAQAEFLVLAKNGVGLAACAEHRDLTVRVVRELDTFEAGRVHPDGGRPPGGRRLTCGHLPIP